MAFQDSWAEPLARNLVDLFKVDDCDFVRRRVTYDPATGQTTPTETRYEGVVAVERKTRVEGGGIEGEYELACWVYIGTIGGEYATTADMLYYENKYWKISPGGGIETGIKEYSGDLKYAQRLVARAE
jgi:hypothetical protein